MTKPIIRDIVIVAQVQMDDVTPAERGQFAASAWEAMYKHFNFGGYAVESLDVVFEDSHVSLKGGKAVALEVDEE